MHLPGIRERIRIFSEASARVSAGPVDHAAIPSEHIRPARATRSSSATVTLKPGTYTILCDIPGHEEAGMKTTLTVR